MGGPRRWGDSFDCYIVYFVLDNTFILTLRAKSLMHCLVKIWYREESTLRSPPLDIVIYRHFFMSFFHVIFSWQILKKYPSRRTEERREMTKCGLEGALYRWDERREMKKWGLDGLCIGGWGLEGLYMGGCGLRGRMQWILLLCSTLIQIAWTLTQLHLKHLENSSF